MKYRIPICGLLGIAVAAACAAADAQSPARAREVAMDSPAAAPTVSVLTYHNDTFRTGWNRFETALTPSSVKSGGFTLQHSVALDDQIDAQPLVVAQQNIAGHGMHTVVYVVTESDTVYAIDAATGFILLSRSLGVPFPHPSCSGGSGPRIGIASTPAISILSGSLYVISNTYEGGVPVYRLHSLSLATLQDQLPSRVVAASHELTNGTIYAFDAVFSKQRPALLLSGPTIYAGLGSYCDRPRSRGWLLGWSAKSLAPLLNSELTDQLAISPKAFLSSIWMSGYGPASTGWPGSIWFVTGNSDKSGTTYNATTNLAESVVRMSTDLSTVYRHFTPLDENHLDEMDEDFGSGGVMLLPTQPGLTPELAVAAGKEGVLYLMNRLEPGHPIGSYFIGACYCGPSYFVGSDRNGRIVASGARSVTVWRVSNSDSSATQLVQESKIGISTGQSPGFFTSISSDSTKPGSAVIWAVGHPTQSSPAEVMLFAIDPTVGSVIYSSVAGTWPNVPANANIVPTVANGQVFVASDSELTIFGLGHPMSAAGQARMMAARSAIRARVNSALPLRPGEHAIYGGVLDVNGSSLMLEQRTGRRILVDTSSTGDEGDNDIIEAGKAVLVIGSYRGDGKLIARHIERAKLSPNSWLDDR